ncbi:uncharacterized protein LOC132732992 isoform X4 [Ruditapes philippinarum]|uniref:uncharacterized protein LOC132732992 isoform X4 n=1 Tax=Ruditapes philippinarum TaxID=129788 RepID=UPI00295A9202|nr:uncharacterized protein LOC132732992 isoform X4 [Ruditapes philippinarum]
MIYDPGVERKMKTYHITGLAIRGYFETGKWWKPKKNEVLKCIFVEGKVAVMKGKVNCGSVPKEIQEVSRKFIMAGGNIEAKVIDKNPRYRNKGEEIPCIYIWWSDLNSKQIKDAVKAAREAVAEARKEQGDNGIKFEQQKIPPKEKPGTSSQSMTDNGTSGPAKSSKKQKEKVEGSRKRQSNEFGKDSPNGKVARMEDVTQPKSKSDTMLKNKKDKELPQATVSDSKRVVQDMTDQLQKGEGDISYEKGDMNGDLHSKKSFGQLIDVHGHVETVLDIRTKLEASKSVCKIVQGNYTATGFRVGSRYIMTAAHVTKTFQQGLKFEIQTYAVFNYIKDGILEEENKFFFKEVVYTDPELDISVIELIESSHPFPPPFTAFDQPSLDSCFHLIGHSQGSVMSINPVTKIININNPGVRDQLEQLQKLSYEYTGKSYDDLPHNTLYNPHRFLFQCKFTQGGSGSPGVVLIDEKVIVTTVLLYGYPDWCYNQSMESYKMNWPLDYCIEQGVNMMSVRKKMLQTNLALCINIFGQTVQQ